VTGPALIPSPRKHGLKLHLGDARLPRAEPRWDADRRAPSAEGAAVPAARQVGLQRLSAFHILSFSRSPDEAQRSPGAAYELHHRPRIALRSIRATAKRTAQTKPKAPPLHCNAPPASPFNRSIDAKTRAPIGRENEATRVSSPATTGRTKGVPPEMRCKAAANNAKWPDLAPDLPLGRQGVYGVPFGEGWNGR
jgi:hypothetical protein